MLSRLQIKNLALIDEIIIEFEDGLNVLTGETGAGKSLIIDALNILSGERADKALIQNGKDFALVEGIFVLSDYFALKNKLLNFGIEIAQDGLLIVSRQISHAGKNYSRINGISVTITTLREVSNYLFDIHGQHEHQSLLSTEKHIEILDSLGGEEIFNARLRVSENYELWKEARVKLKELSLSEKEQLRLKDILTFQIDEIEKAGLCITEMEDLLEEKIILQNAERITEALKQSYALLYSGSQKQVSAHDQLVKALQQLKQIESLDKKIEQIATEIETAYYQVEEIISSLRSIKDSYFFDSERLDEIENRIAHINFLRRKYGNTISEILNFLLECKEKLLSIENREISIIEQNELERKHYAKLISLCGTLSRIRHNVADKFSESLLWKLSELGMEKTQFKVSFKETGEFGLAGNPIESKVSESGFDEIEFLISTNLGEPLKPLTKIVSGGEISRIMLAFKTILAGIHNVPVLIFDEVDTGISGRIAQVVAEKMISISNHHQIICVTHLPQIAAMADLHLYVTKYEISARTVTKVEPLNFERRQYEIAAMLAGSDITDLSLSHSGELIERATEFKKKNHFLNLSKR